MFYTYVLLCEKCEKKKRKIFYIGFTTDLKHRLKEHFYREVKTTKKFDKITLIYYEACISEKDARLREKQLKTGFGRGYLKRRLKNYLINAGLVERFNVTLPR